MPNNAEQSTPMAKKTEQKDLASLPDDALITWHDGVEHMVPVSKNSWMSGCDAGRYPPRRKIGPRLNAWLMGEVRAFCRGEWKPEVKGVPQGPQQ